MLTPFPWASSLGQQPKRLVKLPNLQLVGRIRLRELVPASTTLLRSQHRGVT